MWFAKHVWLLKYLLLCARYSDGCENKWGARHAIATLLLTAVCGFPRARFVTRVTHKPLRHRARYIKDHVIVLFDIIVEEINSFWGVDLPFENCLHMPDLDSRLSYSAEKCSWNFRSSGIPPPSDSFKPVLASSFCTTGCIFLPYRYAL